MAKLPGSVWIDGTDIHFINESGVEYYYTGDLAGASAGIPGSTWIDGDFLNYVDAAGAIRKLAGINDATGISALVGCIWIEASRIKATVSGSGGVSANKRNYHYDAGHGDIIHNDIAHTDGGGAHDDLHNDSHIDNSHGDLHNDQHFDGTGHCDGHYDQFGGATHQDLTFPAGVTGTVAPYSCHGDYTPPDSSHGDAHVDDAVFHDDLHSDSPHLDSPHQDVHSDSHGDQASHADTPHTDVPHADAAHADMPVLVGS